MRKIENGFSNLVENLLFLGLPFFYPKKCDEEPRMSIESAPKMNRHFLKLPAPSPVFLPSLLSTAIISNQVDIKASKR